MSKEQFIITIIVGALSGWVATAVFYCIMSGVFGVRGRPGRQGPRGYPGPPGIAGERGQDGGCTSCCHKVPADYGAKIDYGTAAVRLNP